jgi:integral membrane sensor domain MASE1
MGADTAPLAARDLDAAALPLLGESALLGGVYFVLAFVAIHMGGQPHAITNVWFANAAAIAILATTSRRRWLPLLGVIAAANVAANAALRGDLALSASFVPGNLIEVVIGAALLVRTDLARRFDDGAGTFTLALVAGGMLPQLAGATLGAATLQWHGFATFSGAWLSWYVDSTLGAMAVLPLALALRNAHAAVARAQLFTGMSLLFALVTIVAVLVTFRTLSQPYIFLTLPLMASVLCAGARGLRRVGLRLVLAEALRCADQQSAALPSGGSRRLAGTAAGGGGEPDAPDAGRYRSTHHGGRRRRRGLGSPGRVPRRQPRLPAQLGAHAQIADRLAHRRRPGPSLCRRRSALFRVGAARPNTRRTG